MIINNDCLQAMKNMEDNSIDLLVTDPPYGYSFMGKDWDKAVPSVEIWKEALRVLKPGAFCFVMSAPRQDVLSQMIVRLGEAGFRTDFTSLYWTYASGFPKASNIGKMVDKRFGLTKIERGFNTAGQGIGLNPNRKLRSDHPEYKKREAQSDQAKALEGSYGGFNPKPAVEVIIVCMKPLSEKTYVDQALKNGKGISWLDDCRIPYESDDPNTRVNPAMGEKSDGFLGELSEKYCPNGSRFPANLLVSDDVLNDGKEWKGGQNSSQAMGIYGNKMENRVQVKRTSDSGSFSRYFDLDKWYTRLCALIAQN